MKSNLFTVKRPRLVPPTDSEKIKEIVGLIPQFFDVSKINTVADVAGSRGELASALSDEYGFECTVIDPEDYSSSIFKVARERSLYSASMADRFDLIVGMHPDGALAELLSSSVINKSLIAPCHCNYCFDSDITNFEEMMGCINSWYEERDHVFIEHKLQKKYIFGRVIITNSDVVNNQVQPASLLAS